jgi:hypothetical protein
VHIALNQNKSSEKISRGSGGRGVGGGGSALLMYDRS